MTAAQTDGGALPLLMGKVFAATLYYKVNPYVTFGFEQSVYGTRLGPGAGTNCALTPGSCYSIAGSLDNLWQAHRLSRALSRTFASIARKKGFQQTQPNQKLVVLGWEQVHNGPHLRGRFRNARRFFGA